METFWQDARFALRAMLKAPGFTAVAILSLALGVGANTTIFTLLNAVLLTPLPFDRPSELVAVYTTAQERVGPFGGLLQTSYLNLRDYREQNTVLQDMAGYTFAQPVSVLTEGEPQQAFMELVTGNYFAVLGVRPHSGRFFLPEEDVTPGSHPVVVLGHGFWQRRLGGDGSLLGRTLSLNGTPFTVIGIAPEGFKGVNSLFSPDMWVPTMMYAQVLPTQFRTWLDSRRALLFSVAARLKPGVMSAQAEANLKTIASALEREYPAPNKGRSVTLRPLSQATIFPGIREAFVRGGALLMTIVGLVLLIACSNVANLLMARASARRQEIAVRVALGANRRRLMRQLLTESLLLALAAGVVGLTVAYPARNAIWSLRPPFLAQNFVDLTFDGRVLLFTAAVSLLTALLFGLLPSLQASRPDVVGALKEETRSAGPSRRRFALSNMLVVAQVALSVVALGTAGLFVRSLQRANQIDPGFDVRPLALVNVNPGEAGYDATRALQFFQTVSERLASVSGVEATAWGSGAPLTPTFFRTVLREGENPETTVSANLAVSVIATPGYFRTVGVPLLRGRDFTDADREETPLVAIVNETLAERLWPNQEPIGQRFRFFTDSLYREVVGVAKTVKYNFIGEDPQIAVYTPLEQERNDAMVLIIRATGDPGAALGEAQRQIRDLDARVPVMNPFTMEEILAQSLWPPRMAAMLLGVLGALALVLASVGLYGLLAYSVAQRTQEIGLRMALGAGQAAVLAMVLRHALKLAAIGLAIGLGGALAVSRVVSGLLFGTAMDPATFIAVALLLIVVALLASYMPAWRASRLDPLAALR
ncbi:MAG: ABC transporter permease [Gemmatimonadetes bacterium]|nr:ABC transporter permease [Gemmatimonadota bacterium]